MDIQLIIAMISFAFVTSATPGPNNIMLLASGANYGFKRTIPHMLGISFGVALLIGMTLLGLGEIFTRLPSAQLALKLVGIIYLLWLAWKIGAAPVVQKSNNTQDERTTQAGSPFKWWQAAAFQFVNPKAWMMALGAVSSFTLAGEAYWASGLLLMILFVLVSLPSISIWAGFGTVMQRFLSTPQRQRLFNGVMGLLTAATVVLLVM